MKLLVLVLAVICSVSAIAANENNCSIRNSKYEKLKFSLGDSTAPAIELGEENATFAVNAGGILQFGEHIPIEKCQITTIINDESMLMTRWHCAPAFSSEKYFSFIEFAFYKQEHVGSLHFGFTDIHSYGGPERHIEFSCL